MASSPLVVVIGGDQDPTTALAADLRRLSYHPEVVVWADSQFRAPGRPPLATIVDFRTLGVDAEKACAAVRKDRTLRRAPCIAVVPELEASRLDLSFDFDDLILAPYRISELAVRLRLARWRAEAETSGTKLVRAGALSLNETTYEVTVSGVPIELTLKEYQLLLFLMHHPGRVFTRAEILDRVWGMDYYGGTRTVDVHIRRLRSKTEAAGDILETIRGVGYRLAPPTD